VRVVATGPVASGTRLLHRILAGWGLETVHRSMPNYEDFWTADDFPPDVRFVIITRRPDISTRSALVSGHGLLVHRRIAHRGWKGDDDHLQWEVTKEKPPEPNIWMMEWWWTRAMETFAAFPQERTRWMAYEALVAAPDAQLQGLADWLGVEKGPTEEIYDGNEPWR